MAACLPFSRAHLEVVFPVGGDINDVDVLTLAEFFVTLLAVIDLGRGHPGLAQNVLASLGTLLLVVAKGHNLHTGNIAPTLNGTGATHTQTDEADTYDLELRRDEV